MYAIPIDHRLILSKQYKYLKLKFEALTMRAKFSSIAFSPIKQSGLVYYFGVS